MSLLKKRNKIDIKFYSSGKFLNLDKPKLLSIDKSEKYNLKNIKIKSINHNISEDISNLETITKMTENSSKDEIIKVLKERLTILENKVKILEKENNDNIKKINLLNLSHGHIEEKKRIGFIHKKMKLNLKLGKNKSQKKILNILNLSRDINNDNRKKIYNRNSCFNNFGIFNNGNYINNKQKNEINFMNIFNVNNTNKLEREKDNISFKNKTKNCLLIPNKKLLFDDRFKKTLNKTSSIDIDNLKNNNLKIDFNKNISKIPKKPKQNGSEINNKFISKYNFKIKYNPDEYNNIILKRSNSEKKKDFVFINSNNINKNFINDFNINEINNNKFNLIKNKLENIKQRTKNLLYYYSLNNTNTDNK
jgi:hypothetical protein